MSLFDHVKKKEIKIMRETKKIVIFQISDQCLNTNIKSRKKNLRKHAFPIKCNKKS